MDLMEFRNGTDKILDCEVKDHTGLNDFQKLPDDAGIAIPKVGIERFRLPLLVAHRDLGDKHHDAVASMYVNLESSKTGVNMSRFCTIVQERTIDATLNNDLLKQILNDFRYKLRDYDHEEPIKNSFIEFTLSYPMKQQSLKSSNWGWQYYDVQIKGQNLDGNVRLFFVVKYEYSSTCPCSLSMAKQYEEDYRAGKTTEGNGIATAHSQRSTATVEVEYDSSSTFWINDLIHLLRIAIPTETQSLVKRADEQAFAILNGSNPMFVEHASRRLSKVLDAEARIFDWKAKVEHIESLHSHNAVAEIRKIHQ